jgi:AcrR family transcriptional regulator
MTETSDPPRAEATRARLLAAAVSAFAEKGFHGTTTRDIAAAAGMSPAALYIHFKSKEELLHRISLIGHERTLADMRAAIAAGGDPAEQVRRVVRGFAVAHARDHTTARIINYELVGLSPEHFTEIRELRQQTTAELRGLVERGVAAGVFATPDPGMAANAVLSLGIDIARWYREEGNWSPEDIGDRYAEMALRILGCDRGCGCDGA